MGQRSTNTAHAGCRIHNCVQLAGLLGTSERGPDRARSVELAIRDRFASWGWSTQHHPKIGYFSAEGTEIEPDIGFKLGTGPGLVSRGAEINVLAEVKTKDTTGSADDKVEKSILTYAALSDETTVVTLLISALCPASLSTRRLDALESFATENLVAYINLEDLTPDSVRQRVDAIRARREKLRGEGVTAMLSNRFDVDVLAAAYRQARAREAASRFDARADS